MGTTLVSPGRALILVENLSVPFDRRVWMEATTLQQAGWDVTVVCPRAKGFDTAEEVLDGIQILRHPLPPEGSTPIGFLREYVIALLHEARLVHKAWSRTGFDVIHICNPPDLLFTIAAWYRYAHRVKVIFDQHDLGPELFVAKYGRRGILHRVLLACERLTYFVADHVISTNQSYRDIATSRGAMDPDDVTIVRSAPDMDRFVPVAPTTTYHRGATHLIGYVGVMGDQEGLDVLLQAIRHITVTRGRTGIQVMLIGGGPARESLEKMASDLGIADTVEFTGRIPDDELIARLSSADVCVAPDPKNGFNELCTMNKVLEYMALGRPIVQFDLHEGRRSAEGASAYAVPNDPSSLGDTILDVLDAEADRRDEMSRIGRDRMFSSLGWAHQRKPLLSIYDRLLSARRRRSTPSGVPVSVES